MQKAFKYRLYPNKATEKKLYFVLNHCRELYNAALSERKDAYQLHQRTVVHVNPETGGVVAAMMVANQRVKTITYTQQQNDLPEIKHELRPEYEEIAAHVLHQSSIRWTDTHQSQSPLHLTSVLRLWTSQEKGLIRTMA